MNHSGYGYLNTYLVKIKGLKTLSLINCSLTPQELKTVIINNLEVHEINFSNCTVPANQLLSMLSHTTTLQQLHLCKFVLQPSKIKGLFNVLSRMKYLRCVNLSENTMKSDAVNEIAAMVKNNKGIQSLSLPNCVLNQKDLRNIIQAMQTVSSLQYIDFNLNKIDNELASDVATLFANNNKLQQLNFQKLLLSQSGFENIKLYLVKLQGLKYIDISNFTNSYVWTSNVISNITAMIKNNVHIQSFSLQNSILDQNYLRIIIQALQTVSSLQYVDFSNNSLNDELAGDVALLVTKNRIEVFQTYIMPEWFPRS